MQDVSGVQILEGDGGGRDGGAKTEREREEPGRVRETKRKKRATQRGKHRGEER